jgi:N-acetylglucosaminyldiphosphoundecaprenol N-acetyl-beta-D-mannosaminyltransferase
VIALVNASKADILLVGFGTPVQERWIAHNFQALHVPVVWAVGALVDFVAGKQRRAPEWMLAHDLEWLGRLAAEPRRMWRRYLVGNPLFFYRVIKQRAGLWHPAWVSGEEP